ncbi:uncharacterized protein LOC106155783 [Lingula anatina]|uniref:Uncharacterized protein LOC106155783 n=1 Tax=Lingula anatina TaxID=7574 RepID=A0A1S3HL99_LINAN|nr:uncharacterized protein LOC106155783 [Lingula anatina]XP_013386236.1 uncharacterized protein LOC106155783 [Lingula anatina]|eukprot:XP_013386235.1 uncharacterized protein LOC106155783 [Lingula anatina]
MNIHLWAFLIFLTQSILCVQSQNDTTNATSTPYSPLMTSHETVTLSTSMTSVVTSSTSSSLTSTASPSSGHSSSGTITGENSVTTTTAVTNASNATVTKTTGTAAGDPGTTAATLTPKIETNIWQQYRFYILGGGAGFIVLSVIVLFICCACCASCRRCCCNCCLRLSCSEGCRAELVDFEQCLATCCCRHGNKTKHQSRQHYPHPFTTFDYDSSTLGTDKNGYMNGHVYTNGHVHSNGHLPMTQMGHDVLDGGSISKRSDSSKSSDVNHNAVPKSKNKEQQPVEITQITVFDPSVNQPVANGHVEPVTNGNGKPNGNSNSGKSNGNGHVTNSPAGFMKFRGGKGNYKLTPLRERKKIYMNSKDGDTFLFVPSCPDGDCFFRAFTIATHEILQKCERHAESGLPLAEDLFRFENEKVFNLRKEMCDFMREHFSRYEKKALELVHQGSVKDMDSAIPAMDIPAPIHDEQYQSFYDELNAMQHPGTYACQLEIAAVADMKKTKVFLYQKLLESPKSLRGKDPRINIAKVIELGQPEFEDEIDLVYMPIDHGRSGHYDALVKVETATA